MKIFTLRQDKKLSKKDRDEIVSLLNKGGTVVVPTDTSYGLAALVTSKKGVDSVYRMKGRHQSKSVSMAVCGRAQGNRYGKISCKPIKLWKAFMPGPFTLVVDAKKMPLHKALIKGGTVAVRMVPTVVIKQLLRVTGVPLTITSANKSGKPDIYSYQQFKDQYKNGILPTAFIDAGKLAKKRPSTVVRYTKKKGAEVLRKGSISLKQINEAIKK